MMTEGLEKALKGFILELHSHGLNEESLPFEKLAAAVQAPPGTAPGYAVRGERPQPSTSPVVPNKPPQNPAVSQGMAPEQQKGQQGPQTQQGQQGQQGQVGSVAPVMELSRILDDIVRDPAVNNLPPKVKDGLKKIHKMTENAFRYASEDIEAALFGKAPLNALQDMLQSFGKKIKSESDLPQSVLSALSKLKQEVDTAVLSKPKEPGILERGMEKARDIGRQVSEKGRQISEKGQEMLDRGKEVARKLQGPPKQVQEQALSSLKNSLMNSKYRQIYYKLPTEIIRRLDSLGLGLDDLTPMGPKTASLANKAVLAFLEENLKKSREVAEFVMRNPNPSLDDIHALAKKLHASPEEGEEMVSRALSQRLRGKLS